jgi:hypothetical protein
MPTTKHKCPILGCHIAVPSHMLMCSAHWHEVPKDLQNAVYSQYRHSPHSDTHFEAMARAVNHVNNLHPLAADTCYFGIATGNQCQQTPVWVSTFEGEPIGMLWCDEHKPDATQILSLSDNRHGVKRIQETK